MGVWKDNSIIKTPKGRVISKGDQIEKSDLIEGRYDALLKKGFIVEKKKPVVVEEKPEEKKGNKK